MATKWKNSLVVLAALLLGAGLSGIITFLQYSKTYFGNSFFETSDYRAIQGSFIDSLNMLEVNGLTKEEALKQLKVSDGDIQSARQEKYNLDTQIRAIYDEYHYQIEEASRSGEKEKAAELEKERDKKISEMERFFKDDEYVRAILMKQKVKKLETYYANLEVTTLELERGKQAFNYYFEDVLSGKIYTNISTDNMNEAIDKISQESPLYSKQINTLIYPNGPPGIPFDEKQLSGYIGVAADTPENHPVMASYDHFMKMQKSYYINIIIGFVSLITSLVIFTKLTLTQERNLSRIFKAIPIDVMVLVSGLATIAFVISLFDNRHSFFVYVGAPLIGTFIKSVLIGIPAALIVLLVTALYKRMSDPEFLSKDIKGSLVGKAYHALKEAFLHWEIGAQILALLAVIVGFIPITAFIFGRNQYIYIIKHDGLFWVYAVLLVAIAVPIIYLILKYAGQFNRILVTTEELANGTIGKDLVISGNSPLSRLARNINSVKQEVKESHKEQVKSERLKTELITNVSHDLRTPLTSIITYTELLKMPQLAEEERESYIEIIDRKSKRLKVLIDDLFEASKMASGAIELVKTKVDLVQLLNQSLAEHDEHIQDSGLVFRVSLPEHPVYAVVDGQKIWRVFDNLILNILKYTQEGTRVYLAVRQEGNLAWITFKNISRYELNGNGEELFERFKRGDTSRHTEGSGLGLAIAKSIIDLHDGRMDIETDGDLFKVTIELEIE
ncbi:sensor histidine kinase [Bacillus sp. EB01]|uniref:sensor histidine kinase n=1 Tax=Bacillus sp. EB01 TaxID=1347086 RepID=UPI0005C746B2|nr:HAMP domain-containing sensor histidine kinase [Bacillus sp. EB01]